MVNKRKILFIPENNIKLVLQFSEHRGAHHSVRYNESKRRQESLAREISVTANALANSHLG